tara:strand:- start:1629 stop:1832 length:204 start_codon:yes stop_codon:yes gene_type:complete
MITATLDVLEPEDRVFGSKTSGQYCVRLFEDGLEMSGAFFKTEQKAKDYIAFRKAMIIEEHEDKHVS